LAEPDGGALAAPEATTEDSRARGSRPAVLGRRIAGRIWASGPAAWLTLTLGLASAVLLFLTELATLSYRTIGIGGCESRVTPGVCTTTGADAHHHAMWLLALVVLVFSFGAAVGRSRPAALAVMAAGAVALGIGLIGDRPDLGDRRGLDADYTDVRAHTGSAYTFELIGGVLALASGLAALTRPQREAGASQTREERAAARAARRGGDSAPPG
jgi:hypothetical protein